MARKTQTAKRGLRPPSSERARRAQRGRRGVILDAALKVFTQAGYSGASMEDIGYESGASIGSIYHHFKGKEELAAAVHVEGLADYHRDLHRELRVGHDGAEQAVKSLVRFHLRWIAENADTARFLLTSREPEVVGVMKERLAGMNRDIFAAVRQWVKRWVDAGELQALPIELFYSIVLGPSQELARHWLTERVKESIDEVEPALAEAAWRGVRT